jgi:hypothetical protein
MTIKISLIFGLIIVFLAAVILFKTKTPPRTICGPKSCHGLDIKCGANEVKVCDAMYEMGDNCRQFVSCAIKNNQCQAVESNEFLSCKTCVQNCNKTYPDDVELAFTCENGCIKKQN